MEIDMDWPLNWRARFWWSVLGVYLVCMLVECSVYGVHRLSAPFPIAGWATDWAFVAISLVSLAGAVMYGRDLHRHRHQVDSRERLLRRAIVVIYIGGSLGFMVRVLTQTASVTFSTPIIVVGYVMAMYPVVRKAIANDRAG